MQNNLLERLQQYLLSRYSEAVISNFGLVNGGWECDIYAFHLAANQLKPRDLILRLYLGQDGDIKAARESAGLRRLHQAGYAVPELLLHEADTTILGKPFMIMEKLYGQGLWGALSMSPPDREAHLLDQFSRLQAQLHRLDWQPFTEHAVRYTANPPAVLDDLFTDWRESYARFGVTGFFAVLGWLEDHLSTITVQPAVVHLDFHANNVFLHDDDRMSVIDWSQITVSDYRYDLAWTLMIMGDHGQPHWHDHILSAYTDAAGHPVEQLDYFKVINYTKLLGSAVISLQAGVETQGLRPESIETMKQQGASLQSAYQRLQAITGVTVPEVEEVLSKIT